MILPLPKVELDLRVRALCLRPYPNHAHGCPNYGRKLGCPPAAPMFGDRIDVRQMVFAIVNHFDFRAHVERMHDAHPRWSQRQLECCLYWQSRARKQLSGMVKDFLREHPGNIVDPCPEAGGVNVTETLRLAGVNLEWPPRKIACQVALAGYPIVPLVSAAGK